MIFITIGEIDVESYGAQRALNEMETRLKANMEYYEEFAKQNGFAVKTIIEYAVNPVEKIAEIAEKLASELGDCIYFASSLVWGKESWFAQYLHNETAFSMQRKLHMQNQQMIIIPMNIDV